MTREEAITVLKAFMENPLFSDVHKNAFNIAIHDIKQLEQESCDDAISRKDAYEIAMMPDTPFGKHKGILIRELPPVTPQQKIGHWEWVQYDYNPKLGNWHCSECRSIVIECVDKNDKGGIPLYKYCPQCGAKIQESEE